MGISLLTPTSWSLSSVPSARENGGGRTLSKTDLTSGYDRARLAWYTIDPLFTRRSSTLTPGHIKEDLEQLSNHYVREVYVSELYPNRDQNTYSGATSTLSIMNLAFYPQERGPYNFNPNIDQNGHLLTPRIQDPSLALHVSSEKLSLDRIKFFPSAIILPDRMTPEERKDNPPKVVFVDDRNKITSVARYEKHGRLGAVEQGGCEKSVEKNM